MKCFTGFEGAVGALPGAALALGTFDGIHRGHRALIGAAIDRARARQRPMAVVTFDPPPVAVLAPQLFRAPLTPLKAKLACLAELGVDAVVVQPFDRAFADREARAFIAEDLLSRLLPAAIFVGENFNFGRGRIGNSALLRAACQPHGVEVVSPPLIREGATTVSSTEIRRRLSQGDLAGAAHLLGRPYVIEGAICHGRGRGHSLGFPTANLKANLQFLPRGGVYAAWARVAGNALQPAVLNIGQKPTFGERDTTIEAFLLDETRDLYGQALCLEPVARLRDERRFDSPAALRRQIERDCEATRARLALAWEPGPLT